jgi:hypothetical protein
MSQMIVLGIPDHDELLKALGRLAIAHGNLEMVQIMCLKTLEHLRPDKALEEYRQSGAARIRERIEDAVVAKARSGEERRKKDVIEPLRDARCHSKRRNALLHRFWGKDPKGDWRSSGDESNWEGLPDIAVIDDLVKSIRQTTKDLNDQRFNGGYLLELAGRCQGQATS